LREEHRLRVLENMAQRDEVGGVKTALGGAV
jgi:hypothetical protein